MSAFSRVAGVLLVVWLLVVSGRAQQPEKTPLPDAQIQGEARKAAAALYKADYTAARGNKEALSNLARKVLGDAAKVKDDEVGYFVLLNLAKDIATGAGDAELAVSALDRMGDRYDMDALQAKADCLSKIGGSSAGGTDYKTLAEVAFSLVDDAMARDDYQLADYLVEMARAGARRAKHYDLAKRAFARKSEIEEQAQQFAELQKALKVLENDPGNSEANTIAGRHLCLRKGDWERGLPMLAVCSDELLKSAAEKELQSTTEANEQLAVAEAWWNVAENEEGDTKEVLMLHAGTWYERAKSSGVSGISKITVDNRLREIAKIERSVPDVPTIVIRTEPGHDPEASGVPKGQTPDFVKAPFDMTVAREHQKAWAKHLDAPYEWKNRIGMAFILIPPGEFMMGTSTKERERLMKEAEAAGDQQAITRIPSEGPQHRVQISRPFYLGKYEVTQAQWQTVMGNNPSAFTDSPLLPVERVSWDDIQPFLAKLNAVHAEEGLKYGLPTEAQWEYACRAGTTAAFCFGDNEAVLLQYGWHKDNSRGKTNRIGQGKPNAWGAYDMHGNVWEWCVDWHSNRYYDRSPSDDPVGPDSGVSRVFRGGCWTQSARMCRSALRNGSPPATRDGSIGLRLVLTFANEPTD